MFNFFRGWKRKVGVVMLLAATAFAVGWIRSGSHNDILLMQTAEHSQIAFESAEQRIFVVRYRWDQMQFSRAFIWASHSFSDFPNRRNRFKQLANWRSITGGFGYSLSPPDPTNPSYVNNVYAIPYWSIVLPLTVISTFLLLVKPQVMKSKILADN